VRPNGKEITSVLYYPPLEDRERGSEEQVRLTSSQSDGDAKSAPSRVRGDWVERNIRLQPGVSDWYFKVFAPAWLELAGLAQHAADARAHVMNLY
jgi:hypothetical protein